MSGRNNGEKQPKIKGLVKRCRSFKEDIISRLARNRSLAKDESGRKGITGGWTSGGTSPVPSDPEITDPVVLIAHRLKEAYLTLQFVESLIQKNCVDLLGGSSNVMLDLMGHLLNDIKGLTAISHTAAYQSTVSQLKSALGDFLTAIDVLLLKERCDDVQKELYFEKVLDTLKATREALARLKSLVDTKENGNHHYTNSVRHHSTSSATQTYHPQDPSRHIHHHHLPHPKKPSTLLTSTPTTKGINSPTSKPDGSTHFPLPLSPISNVEARSKSPTQERRPPLPPKLKQWTAKSFDSEWLPSQQAMNNSSGSPHHHHSHSHTSQLAQLVNSSSSNLSPHHQSLLSQWLEQSTSSANNPHGRHHRSLSQHHHHNQGHGGKVRQPIHSTSSTSKFDSSEGNSSWTESAIYVSRSTHSGTSSVSGNKAVLSSNPNLNQPHRKPARTYSDSYQLEAGESQESLDKVDYEYDSRSALSGRSAATHNSQSLSLGSSLDNLLLVDGQSQQSGLSPNSNSNSGGGGASGRQHNSGNRASVSSNLSGHLSTGGAPHGLSNFPNLDPDGEDADGDNVFVSSEALSSKTGPNSLSPRPQKTEFSESGVLEDPPVLPAKQNRRQFLLGQQQTPRYNGAKSTENGQSHYFENNTSQRCPSPYENVDETDMATWHGSESRDSFSTQPRNFMSYSESRNTLVGSGGDSDDRPPLPPKKKHSLIAAYVEFLHNFESYSQQQQQQHHSHFHNHLNHIHHQQAQSPDQLPGTEQSLEMQRRQFRTERSATLHNPGGGPLLHTGYSSRTACYSTSYHQFSFTSSLFSPTSEEAQGTGLPSSYANNNGQLQDISPVSTEEKSFDNQESGTPPALPPKKSKQLIFKSGSGGSGSGSRHSNSPGPPVVHTPNGSTEECSPVRQLPTVVTPVHPSTNNSMDSPQLSMDEQTIDLYTPDVSSMLIHNDNHAVNNVSNSSSSSNRPGSEGPEIKGGEPHHLIIYAGGPDLKDTKFREVFLLTYRTFVRPIDVVNLLWKRYQHFEKKTDRPSLVHARATLDLFVDVVNSLTPMDLEDEMVAKLRECIYHLVSCGEIQSALKARKGLIQKYQIRQRLLSSKPPPATLAITTAIPSLLEWSATSIAQQMTLLDAELFRQLEPAELLLWAREQSEDFCPALNNFTEHFNKVSYWARSKVLLCCNSRERNRTMKKMIEVMRKLREYNNFNSLLAVLAALDSAPIRRLGFSRRLTEALKPHAALTDSSGSFRTYRQALSESKSPCIPYIGLVLQDLTFVHIGNADLLPDGKVNWIKRWQQWVVLEPVRRFHSCNYGFVRNDPLLTFLNNFDESLNDDELWQLSESIKPRSKN